jgi:hypothetical protein
MALVHAVRRQGGSVHGIARKTGRSQPTVRTWLGQPGPSAADGALGGAQRLEVVRPPAPRPAPWQNGK